MSVQQISAKITGDHPRAGQVFTVNYDIPETIQEAVNKWGEEVVYSRFKQSLVIDIQSKIRGEIKKDNATPETVQEAVSQYTPDVKRPGVPFSQKVEDFLKNMDPEERRAFIEDLV